MATIFVIDMIRKWVSAVIGSLPPADRGPAPLPVDHAVAVRGDRDDARHVAPLDRGPQDLVDGRRVNGQMVSSPSGVIAL